MRGGIVAEAIIETWFYLCQDGGSPLQLQKQWMLPAVRWMISTRGRTLLSGTVSMAEMTSGQLARRARIIEAVIGLIGDVGAEAVQMRDVAQRSGVALATVYRYFSSRENLLAAALEDWQKRLTRRVLAGRGPSDEGPLPGILDYLQRAQRAFH